MSADGSTKPNSTVYVIDDHATQLQMMRQLCGSVGLDVRTYETPGDFLDQLPWDASGCVVADLLMPKMSGLELHEELSRRGFRLPIIVLTGHADAATCRQAFHRGVFDFVEKSANTGELMIVIQRALRYNEQQQAGDEARLESVSRLERVSPREKEVMRLLADGRPLKEIAVELSISVQTASKHRGKLFDKLGVSNEVDLYKLLKQVEEDANRSPDPKTMA
ncbi:MAG: response regulator [Planctomycetota bacterium]